MPARKGHSPGAAARRLLRSIPAVSDLLVREEVREAIARRGRSLVVALLRERLASLRERCRDGGLDAARLGALVDGAAAWAAAEAERRTRSTIQPVINATGVVLHTNLGRAVLGEAAARRLVAITRAYTTLEYDLGRGRRGSRSAHLERLFRALFPGRSAHVVNNNAAAVLLALNTLAEGREVVVSRGELVEIGGSFRIPDIMRKSGAFLKEVGTTNRTRLEDYRRAIGPRTGLLLKVHPSNYRVVGFTADVPLREVARLGRSRRVPVLMDQGTGSLLDLEARGIRGEPTVGECLAAGADLVCFSGDKLLGGPQAGILVGRPGLVRRLCENPLSRALRVDKMTYAALEASLLEYVRGGAEERVPVARMIALTREEIARRARRVLEAASGRGALLHLSIADGVSVLGGGSAPQAGLPTALLSVSCGRLSARAVEERLRRHTPPIVARIEGQRVLIDLRTVLEDQDAVVAEALGAIASG
ncbi:MAG: L-seryl-tRNA(Sec) selenium transferase [Acidobacteriota bacterium]